MLRAIQGYQVPLHQKTTHIHCLISSTPLHSIHMCGYADRLPKERRSTRSNRPPREEHLTHCLLKWKENPCTKKLRKIKMCTARGGKGGLTAHPEPRERLPKCSWPCWPTRQPRTRPLSLDCWILSGRGCCEAGTILPLGMFSTAVL